MGKSAGSNQPMKMILSVEYFTLWYYSPKAIYTTAWNKKGPTKKNQCLNWIRNNCPQFTESAQKTKVKQIKIVIAANSYSDYQFVDCISPSYFINTGEIIV